MIKAVIDTNVLVSTFWTRNRLLPTVRIVNAIARDVFTPVYALEMISDFVVTPAQFCELLGI